MPSQNTDTLLMIRPINFGFNEQTQKSNAYQSSETDLSAAEIQAKALNEFDAFVEVLRNAGVKVIVVEDTPEPFTPDSIFPNNWVSFHHRASAVLYPMGAPNRRDERRWDILEQMTDEHGLEVKEVFDLTHYELDELFLEGTGSMVLDRANEIVYACLSPRTSPEVLAAFKETFEWEIVSFDAVDENGKAIYHTNVMMCVADTFAILGESTITDAQELEMVRTKLIETGHEIISVSQDQVNHFAGNMLQVRNKEGKPYTVMSSQAYYALTPEQIGQIEKHNSILHSDIGTIEHLGGGSARCMMAEVFLPPINSAS